MHALCYLDIEDSEQWESAVGRRSLLQGEYGEENVWLDKGFIGWKQYV